LPDRAAPKPLTRIPALLEYHLVRLWHVERLVIHLGLGDVKFGRHPSSDGVLWFDDFHTARLSIAAIGRETAQGQVHRRRHASVSEFAPEHVWREPRVPLGDRVTWRRRDVGKCDATMPFRPKLFGEVESRPLVHRFDEWRRPVC